MFLILRKDSLELSDITFGFADKKSAFKAVEILNSIVLKSKHVHKLDDYYEFFQENEHTIPPKPKPRLNFYEFRFLPTSPVKDSEVINAWNEYLQKTNEKFVMENEAFNKAISNLSEEALSFCKEQNQNNFWNSLSLEEKEFINDKNLNNSYLEYNSEFICKEIMVY